MEQHSESGISEHSSLTGRHHNVPHRWLNGQRKELCQHRKISSREAVLVIVWVYLVSSYVQLMFASTFKALDDHSTLNQATSYAFFAIAALSPLAGLIAGVHFGTYKVMRIGLWLMWIGSVATATVLTLQGLLLRHSSIVVSVSLFFPIMAAIFGIFAFTVNLIPFGLDQMPDASTEQITSFIHWMVWSVVAGGVSSRLGTLLHACAHMDHHNISMICALLFAVTSSVALCMHFAFHRRLIIEPASRNPAKTIFRILQFAAKHKHPVRRSAFTYCEDEQPSRLDLAKSKYGGPFATEEVEDVKTCLRMLLVTISISALTFPFTVFTQSLKRIPSTDLVHTPTGYQCYNFLVGLGDSMPLWGMLCLLVYEFIFYPFVRNRIPTTLKRVVIAIAAGLLANIILLVTSAIAASDSYMFSYDDHSSFPVTVIVITVSLLNAVGMVCFCTAVLEFVCAQAPYSLRGMLLGLVILAVLIGVILGWGTYQCWKIVYREISGNDPSCNVWFYLFTTTSFILVSVVWCAVARWYKNRERDEPDRGRIYVENYYDYYCTLENP